MPLGLGLLQGGLRPRQGLAEALDLRRQGRTAGSVGTGDAPV
jgi:hypothetical protein